jgi:hypothetical protein
LDTLARFGVPRPRYAYHGRLGMAVKEKVAHFAEVRASVVKAPRVVAISRG